MADLVPNLRRKLMLNVHLKPLGNMTFWNRFTGASLKNIAVKLERKVYYPSEVVVAIDEVPGQLFMLQKGKLVTAMVNHNDEDVQVDEISQPSSHNSKRYLWVLLEESVRQRPTKTSIKSATHSTVISVPVETTMEVLRERGDDYESYCFYRDKLIEKQSEVRQKQCKLCPESDHNLLQCHYYHYMPTKAIIHRRHLQHEKESLNVKQPRRYCERRPHKGETPLRSLLKARLLRHFYNRGN